MTKLSPLQIERLQYQPKLPSSLQSGVNSLELVEGSATQSVRDQEQIKALFANTYGKPTVTFKSTSSSGSSEGNAGAWIAAAVGAAAGIAVAAFFIFKKKKKYAERIMGRLLISNV